METWVYDLSRGFGKALEKKCAKEGMCPETFAYTVNTLIVMMLRTVAGNVSGDINACDEEFERLLFTLVDDVRLRDNVLNAYIERNKAGGLSS